MAWLQQLSDQGDIDWNEVQDVNERWSEESETLGGGAAAVIAIVVTVLTGGAGTGIVGGLGATTTATAATATAAATTVSAYTLAAAAATQAVVVSAVTQTTIGTINNGGKLDRSLSDLGQKDSLRGLGASALTAGLTVGVDNLFEGWKWGREGAVQTDTALSITKGFNLDTWQGMAGFAAHSATDGLASALVNDAIYGGSFSDHLRGSMENQGNDVLSAFAFNWVGTFADNNTEAAGLDGNTSKYESFVEGGWGRTALHATTGGIITEITSGDFATGFVAAGLNQALSDQLDSFAEGMSSALPGKEDAWRTAGSQLAGLTGALLVDGDLNQGSWIAKQADSYNRQLHKAELKLIADNYKEYAAERGISPEQALKELIYFATSGVDEAHNLDPNQAMVADYNDYSWSKATLFLNRISSSEGDITHQDGITTRPFEATEEQYQNSFINRNHLHEIEDGYYGELQGLGRRPILNAYSMDLGAGNYSSALDQARTDSSNAMGRDAAFIFGGALVAPVAFSATAFLSAQASLFASSPSAYFYGTASRVSLPVVDDIAYGVAGMPGSMFLGFGATGGANMAAQLESDIDSRFTDDAMGLVTLYGDDVGQIGHYGRGADDLETPQFESSAFNLNGLDDVVSDNNLSFSFDTFSFDIGQTFTNGKFREITLQPGTELDRAFQKGVNSPKSPFMTRGNTSQRITTTEEDRGVLALEGTSDVFPDTITRLRVEDSTRALIGPIKDGLGFQVVIDPNDLSKIIEIHGARKPLP